MGTVRATSIATGSVVNADIATGAAIETSKLVHQHVFSIDFNFDDSDTPTTKEMTFYCPTGQSTIKEAKALLVDTGSSTAISFDLEISGTTCLTATIDFTNSDANLTPKTGTLASTTVNAGQYLTAIMTVTSATGATGGKMQIVVDSPFV